MLSSSCFCLGCCLRRGRSGCEVGVQVLKEQSSPPPAVASGTFRRRAKIASSNLAHQLTLTLLSGTYIMPRDRKDTAVYLQLDGRSKAQS